MVPIVEAQAAVREDKRDREERKVRAKAKENVEMRGKDLLWLDLRSKTGVHILTAVNLSVLRCHSHSTHHFNLSYSPGLYPLV